MTDMLQEFCDSRGVRVDMDRQAGVIRGVKILGLESRNGRTYLPEALVEAARLYDGAKVHVNHPKGNPVGPRDYQDRIGAIRNVAMRTGEGLFADFHFNPKHALAEQLMWDAEHAPENVGFSHNVEARIGRRGDRVVVEAITRVQSVDLVADPATTRGLFEAAGTAGVSSPAVPVPADSPADLSPANLSPANSSPVESSPADPSPAALTETAGATMTLDDLKRDYPELVECVRREQAEELRELQREVERLTALEAVDQQRQRIETRPQSRDQHLIYSAGAMDAKSFVDAIT